MQCCAVLEKVGSVLCKVLSPKQGVGAALCLSDDLGASVKIKQICLSLLQEWQEAGSSCPPLAAAIPSLSQQY